MRSGRTDAVGALLARRRSEIGKVPELRGYAFRENAKGGEGAGPEGVLRVGQLQ